MQQRRMVALALGFIVLGLVATGYLLYTDAQSQQVPEETDEVCEIDDLDNPDNRT